MGQKLHPLQKIQVTVFCLKSAILLWFLLWQFSIHHPVSLHVHSSSCQPFSFRMDLYLPPNCICLRSPLAFPVSWSHSNGICLFWACVDSQKVFFFPVIALGLDLVERNNLSYSYFESCVLSWFFLARMFFDSENFLASRLKHARSVFFSVTPIHLDLTSSPDLDALKPGFCACLSVTEH